MKCERALLVFTLFVPLTFGFQNHPMPSLEERVKQELRIMYFDDGHPSVEKRLLALGESGAIVSILRDLAVKHKAARPEELEYRYLVESVFALGKLREKRALPLLEEMLKAGDNNLQIFAL